MRLVKYLSFTLLIFALTVGCSDGEKDVVLAPEISGVESKYTILENEVLELSPLIANDNQSVYSWFVDGKVVATTLKFTFSPANPGEYKLIFKAENKGGVDIKETTVSVIALGEPPVITGLEDEYKIEVNEELKFVPLVVSGTNVTYSWLRYGEEVDNDAEYIFISSDPGKFSLVIKAENDGGVTEKEIIIYVNPKPISLSVEVNKPLKLSLPDYVKNSDNPIWTIVEQASDICRMSFVETEAPIFIAGEDGEYRLQLNIEDIVGDFSITVTKPIKQLSPYIAKVFDYFPAPGQFVNVLPKYNEGDGYQEMLEKANDWLVGEDASMITLGGWGGYVMFGFDHTIINVAGKRDFRIYGNAFGAEAGRPGAPFGGSCEPGIIMVSFDANQNGEPDDEWYEIKGSSNFSAEEEPWYDIALQNGNDVNVYRDYEITYFKPKSETPEQTGEPDNPNSFVTIPEYIKWEDNKGNSGYKVKNVYHSQSYFPAWLNNNQLTFSGIRLAENGINEGEYVPGINEGNVYFVLYGYRYGYVDNYPNIDDNSAIDIDWAIDKEGNKVNLPGINFVKVYNGVNQENGWLGEASTEVERGEDLHLLGKSIDTIK